MNNTTKRSVVVSAILAVVLCVSLIAGATYALFTSESSVNVAVTSGKVSVVASVDQDSLTMYSPTAIATDGTITDDANAAQNGQFANGGTVVVDGETITVNGMTPGDSVSFEITVKNNSTVAVKYRTILSAVDNDGMLANGLEITIDNDDYTGRTILSSWAELAANTDPATVYVTIALPTTATTCQGKTLTLTYAVSAVQGNVVTEDPENDTYYVYTPVDLVAFSSNYDTLSRSYQKLEIVNDIDMSRVAYKSIMLNVQRNSNCISIIGNNKTITGLTDALVSAHSAASIEIKNLTIKGATIVGNDDRTTGAMGIGAFVSRMDTGCNLVLNNCHVKSSTITAENYFEGTSKKEPRAGGLVGYISDVGEGKQVTITDCSVTDCTIGSDNGSGGLIGFIRTDATVTNCHVLGYTAVSCTEDREGGAAKSGKVIGTVNVGTTKLTKCTVANTVTVSNNNAKAPVVDGWVGRIVDPGSGVAPAVEKDGVVYTSARAVKALLAITENWTENNRYAHSVSLEKDYAIIDNWTSITTNNLSAVSNTINGNGHKIYGLTAPLISSTTYPIEISNLTIADANISDYGNNTAAFIAYADALKSLKLTGCHVVNSTIGTGTGKYTGGFVGYFSGCTLKISDCSVDSKTVIKNNGDGSIGGIVGFNYTRGGYSQVISNCTVAATLENGNYTGSIVGTVCQSESTDNYGVLEIVLPAGKTFDDSYYGRIVNTTIKCDGTTYTSNAAALAAALQVTDATINVVLASDINLNISLLTDFVGGSGQRCLGGEATTAINLDLNGHKLHLNTAYMSALGAKNANAVITVKNGSLDSDLTSYGTTWNIYDLTYDDCTWKFYDVTFNKAVAVDCGANVYMKDCTITDANNVYGLWISAKAGNVELNEVNINMTGADARAIAIKDQYVDDRDRKQINLTLTNCTFTSAKKAAVLVTNTAGAKITASGCNISAVAADSTNLVWVDNGLIAEVHSGETGNYSDYAANVTVTGGTAIVEA